MSGRGWIIAAVAAGVAVGCKPSGGRAGGSGWVAGDAAATATASAASRAAEARVDASLAPDDTAVPAVSDELATRARHLLEAIVQDDPMLATDVVFPRDAWMALRDSADPGRDWQREVADPFRKSVHALSKRCHGLEAAPAAEIDVGRSPVQATPRKHGWKKPLWTVRGSRLTYDVAGHGRSIPIAEMTSWRGAWYITRLR